MIDPKSLQLQQKIDQIKQQNTELRERNTQISRQQTELQSLRVRKCGYSTVWRTTHSTHTLIVRRLQEGCMQRWRLKLSYLLKKMTNFRKRMANFSNKASNFKKEILKSTGNR